MFIIIEMQTQTDGTVAIVPPVQKTDRLEAQSVYHQALSYAAVSKLPKHSVAILDEEGSVIESRCYFHGGTPNEGIDEV